MYEVVSSIEELSCFCASDELFSSLKNFFVASEPQNLSVPIILMEYVLIKYNAMEMETEINKLKELVENQQKESVVYRQTHRGVQPYNYMSMA